MIVSITLTDFMAHASTVIPLSAGVTVLTGPNNTGKSAVVEALRCVAHNPPPKHFIRHGAKSATVELAFDDGTRVAWVRKPASAIYKLTNADTDEPATYAKLGQGKVPEDVEAVVRLGKVALDEEVSKNPVDVHIGNQREPVFLINQAGTVLAAFLAGATEAAYLVLMQKRLADRMRKAGAETKTLRADRARHLARLDALAPLPDLEMRLSGLLFDLTQAGDELELLDKAEQQSLVAATLRADLLSKARKVEILASVHTPPQYEPTKTLAVVLTSLDHAATSLELLSQRKTILGTLAPVVELADTLKMGRHLAAMASSRRVHTLLTRQAAALSILQDPPKLLPTLPLQDLHDKLTDTFAALHAAQEHLQAVSVLRALPETEPTGPVLTMIERLSKARSTLETSTLAKACLTRLAPLPEPAPTAALSALLAHIREAETGLSRAKDVLYAAQQREAASFERVSARLAEVGSCPLCSARLDVEGFLRRQSSGAPS